MVLGILIAGVIGGALSHLIDGSDEPQTSNMYIEYFEKKDDDTFTKLTSQPISDNSIDSVKEIVSEYKKTLSNTENVYYRIVTNDQASHIIAVDCDILKNIELYPIEQKPTAVNTMGITNNNITIN